MSRTVETAEAQLERSGDDVVDSERKRTRDNVFRVAGKTVEIGMDTAQFGAETVGYSTGRTLHSLWQTGRSLIHGILGEPFRRAA